MKSLILICLIALPLTVHAEVKDLIGRCSFDPQTAAFNKGKFRAGNVVANFYSITDKNGHRTVVSEGISKVDGLIIENTDLIEGSRIDQGSQWPQYQILVTHAGVPPFGASWIDNEACLSDQKSPKPSIIGYDFPKLGAVRSVPANGSFLQNYHVGVGNAYPNCIFWKILPVAQDNETGALTCPPLNPAHSD